MGSIGAATGQPDYDVLIIGCGLSGIYTLYRMQQLGLKVKALEAGAGEGGTWFWNRYPGCRFDSESVSYGFSFSQEVLDEWDWTETFAPGHETLKYAQYLTEKFDLRQHMQFSTKIVSAHYQQDSRSWLLTDSYGLTYRSRFLITAMGILSAPTLPNIPGAEDFKAHSFHTSRWPEDGSKKLKGQRVGIIGTGATGIQIIQTIVKPEYGLESLTVLQRTPNWSAPLRNERITVEEMVEIRKQYPEIFEKCLKSYSGFIHMSDQRKTLEVPETERLAFWEDLYSKPGFGKWLANFADINFDRGANAAFSDFIASKIRQRVKDPKTAEKLIPKNHGFGTRRVPLETHYFEAYNDPRVRLVDVADEAPIERITETGVQLQTGEHIDLDVLIFATGFDAVTGPFTSIDIRGIDGTRLADVWSEGPRTYLGLFVHQFPNYMQILGPHQMFGNIPRSIEYAVGWVSEFLQFCFKRGITYAEAKKEKVQEWTEHVHDCAKGLLANDVDSWMTGVNKNVPGKHKRIVARYGGSGPGYRQRCQDVVNRQYADLDLA
ncbi:Putative FAD/NAD(P)-binding domain superfamily [Septoria linicola]|uniref:FAD/NAD(P)-binding domain superfamily n=1 Tax=Septoria linicola TaxID=215465 RepID=A0A9Q9AZH9_9PEZI|nr:Putative FAD/NAD(P)-binding domain superfamily [Septoria linicola]